VKGDFSSWPQYKKGDNFNGLLYQQGRVLTDVDGTTKTRLDNDWHNVAAGDIIGKGVAAIPAAEPNSFKIESARLDVSQQKVLIEAMSGRAWVDGMLVYLESEPPQVSRLATYLGPPFHDTPPPLIATGLKDAIILEVHQDAINAFQIPDRLIEPALGGPDTTEMLHTSFAFRLLRLSQDDNCSTIPSKLKDNLSDRGLLTVSLQKNPPIGGDCPVDENYGYTGSTHNLYRIEVADTNSGPPKFKYSQFDGGLVGRGKYTDPSRERIRIAQNMQAILWSGLTDFYLEIVVFDEEKGHWRVRYGTNATLNSERELVLSGAPVFGALPPPPEDIDGNGVFFRLWNGIRDISEFTADTPPTMLIDGIRLKFDPPTTSNYRPLDFWIFEVRAGGLENDEKLIDNSPPHGIEYHRVPLAIIEWNVLPNETTASVIEDCRVVFPPLVNQRNGGCCTVLVGDGISSHGHYDSLQDAVNSFGDTGGEICLLDGEHRANTIVENKKDLIIRGCGNRVRILNKDAQNPIITIIDSNNIIIENISFVSTKTNAILLKETQRQKLTDVAIQNNVIYSAKIAIYVIGGNTLNIANNSIITTKTSDEDIGLGIYLNATQVVVEKNRISIDNPKALGGIQIGDGSQKIKILANEISGGSGNGITLGDRTIGGEASKAKLIYEVSIDSNDISTMGLSGIGIPRLFLPGDHENDILMDGRLTQRSLGTPVFDLQICRNHIFNCLQEFDSTMRDEAKLLYRAFGGIVLSYCEKASIFENRIELNGIQRAQSSVPVCGVFVFLASEIQITQNYIYENGPIRNPEAEEVMEVGNRGGIVLIYVTGLNIPLSAGGQYRSDGDYAARIHDNVVNQPIGFALLIGAFGALSVLNNYFNSNLLNNSSPTLPSVMPTRFGGSVMIFNNGWRLATTPGAMAEGGTSTHALAIAVQPRLMAGTIFNNNQTRLAPSNKSPICQLINCSRADLAFGFNEANCFNENTAANTILFGGTIRASNNRFEEIRSHISLMSISSYANVTNYNQGDGCIIVENSPSSLIPVERSGNQVLKNSPQICDSWFIGLLVAIIKELLNPYE
jgi:hypothetical protein